MEFTILFVSADRKRTMVKQHEAPDIDWASNDAIAMAGDSDFVGAGAQWFVGGIWQTDVTDLVLGAAEAVTNG